MKIPLLLVQFLYKNRKLALPGIGVFTLDKSIVLPDENDRELLSLPNGVQFQNANVTEPDKDLISFICENTGKIKPLAISDLESYLALGLEMLNIGKPFYLEGIGTISKGKSGKFDFAPGEYTVIKELTADKQAADQDRAKKSETSTSGSTLQSNRGLIRALAIIFALLVVGWGGYLMYKHSGSATTPDSGQQAQEEVAATVADTLSRADSLKSLKPDSVTKPRDAHDSILYKFVILPTYSKEHALRRYKQLLSFDLRVHLYEKDSTFFKVYFQFPALSKDTTHIKDSLQRQYAHGVTIEE